MKRISLSFILLSIFACGMQVYAAPLIDIPTVEATYKIEDYTIPSFTQFLIAKETAKANPTDANMEALSQKIAELKPYQCPYPFHLH